MRSLLKPASALVSAALLLSAFPFQTFAAVNEDLPENWDGRTGTFTYSLLGETPVERYYYSDDYFSGSGKMLDPHLRTMSLDLAMAAFGDEKTHTDKQLADLLNDLGFDKEKYVSFDYDGLIPTADTIACGISSKATDDGDLVVVGIRGANYGREWGSNFSSGKSGNAKGLSESADKVIKRLKDYEKDNDLKGAKIWISGYSRGGGVSDLTGKYINEHLDEFGITADDLYVYTFEAPRATVEDTNYENIHNVLNPYDLVPAVYPEQWELYNSGVDDVISPAETVTLTPKTVNINILKKKKEKEADPAISAADFEADFLSFVTDNVSREEFSGMSGYISDILVILMSKNQDDLVELLQVLKDKIRGSIDIKKAGKLLIHPTDSEEFSSAATSLVSGITDDLDFNSFSKYLSEQEFASLKGAIVPLFTAVLPLIAADLKSSSGAFYHFATLFENAVSIFSQHDPELILEMVKNEDSYHTQNLAQKLASSDNSNNSGSSKAIIIFAILGTGLLIAGICLLLISAKLKKRLRSNK